MGKVYVSCFSMSVDGYSSGPDQTLDNPLGVGGMALHEWLFVTETWRETHGEGGGATGVDDRFVARGSERAGAWILGRNMFGPERGPWPADDEWKGWWGDEPPYHCPVYVLTHYPRPSLEMEGGTVFHFVDSLDAALGQARTAAGDLDIRVGGGADVIRQFLAAGLIDEMHIAIAPALLGTGTSPFADLDLPALGYAVSEFVPSERVTHIVLSHTGGTVAG